MKRSPVSVTTKDARNEHAKLLIHKFCADAAEKSLGFFRCRRERFMAAARYVRRKLFVGNCMTKTQLTPHNSDYGVELSLRTIVAIMCFLYSPSFFTYHRHEENATTDLNRNNPVSGVESYDHALFNGVGWWDFGCVD